MNKIDQTVKYSIYQKIIKSNIKGTYKFKYEWLLEPKKRWEIKNRKPKQIFMKVG